LLLPLLLEFGLALLAIVVAAAIFTNAVEILGGRLNLGDGAVGSVLAAVGTALPETMFPLSRCWPPSSPGGTPTVLAPLATELPEKLNSVIWIRDGKDTLALGNVTGAMVFQSTVPVTFGVLFTRWELEPLNIFSVVLALLSGFFIYVILRRAGTLQAWHLMIGGLFYLVFLMGAVFAVA
jgi:Ca2+/Na+ antiporter